MPVTGVKQNDPTRIVRDPESPIEQIHLSITKESVRTFIQLVNRALNCWDDAPKELKELGDMITHGYITQDHTYVRVGTGIRTDYYTPKEQEWIKRYIELHGVQAWLDAVNNNTSQALLGRAEPATSTP